MEEKNIKHKIMSGMFWKFGERIIAQVISFIVSIVLARMLTPSDYGIVAIVSVFIVVADVFVTSGLNTALIQKKNATQLDFSTIFYCSLLLAFVIYGILYCIAPFVADIYKNDLLTLVIRVFALKIPLSAFNSIQGAYVSRKMEFRKFFFSTLFGTLVSAVVGIVMAVNGFGVWALIAQYLTNSLIDTTVLFFTVKWRPTLEFSLEAAKPLLRYGWKVMATDLIGTIFNQLNSFIIGLKYKEDDLGYYSKGRSFPELINNNIFTALGGVLFPVMSQYSDQNEKLKNLVEKSNKLLAYIIFPLMCGMIATAKPLIELLLTDKWEAAIPYMQVTCLAGFFSVLGTINLQVIKAMGSSDVVLKLEFIKKPIYLLTIIIAMKISVFAVAITVPFNAFVEMILNSIFVRRSLNYSLIKQIRDIFSIVIASVIMGMLVYVITYINIKNVYMLSLQVVVGLLSYLVLSIVLKIDSFTYLWNMAISNFRK